MELIVQLMVACTIILLVSWVGIGIYNQWVDMQFRRAASVESSEPLDDDHSAPAAPAANPHAQAQEGSFGQALPTGGQGLPASGHPLPPAGQGPAGEYAYTARDIASILHRVPADTLHEALALLPGSEAGYRYGAAKLASFIPGRDAKNLELIHEWRTGRRPPTINGVAVRS